MLSAALERLDQLDEAWAAAHACDAERAAPTEGRQWPDAENRSGIRMPRMRLLARAGQLDLALLELRQTPDDSRVGLRDALAENANLRRAVHKLDRRALG